MIYIEKGYQAEREKINNILQEMEKIEEEIVKRERERIGKELDGKYPFKFKECLDVEINYDDIHDYAVVVIVEYKGKDYALFVYRPKVSDEDWVAEELDCEIPFYLEKELDMSEENFESLIEEYTDAVYGMSQARRLEIIVY